VRVSSRVLDLSRVVISDEQARTRSPGLHLTGVIRHIQKVMKVQDDTFTELDLNHFALVGRCWERYLAEQVYQPPVWIRPGELEKDGIIGSPDVLNFEENIVGEMKACWHSAKTPIESEWYYLTQVKAYCHIVGFKRAIITIVYVGGTWRPPSPIPVEYTLLFGPGELQENWEMILRNAPDVERNST